MKKIKVESQNGLRYKKYYHKDNIFEWKK